MLCWGLLEQPPLPACLSTGLCHLLPNHPAVRSPPSAPIPHHCPVAPGPQGHQDCQAAAPPRPHCLRSTGTPRASHVSCWRPARLLGPPQRRGERPAWESCRGRTGSRSTAQGRLQLPLFPGGGGGGGGGVWRPWPQLLSRSRHRGSHGAPRARRARLGCQGTDGRKRVDSRR